LLKGRRGHARAVIVAVTREELDATLAEFDACHEVAGSGCWSNTRSTDIHPLLVTQSADRSNIPCFETVRDLVEDWRPEYVILSGVAGGIVRLDAGTGALVGPSTGDVVCVEYVHYGEYTKHVDGKRQMRYFPIEHPPSELVRRHVRPIVQTSWADALPVERPAPPKGARPQIHFGELVAIEFLAGDATAEHQREVLAQYDHALAVDMESAGIARAMHSASSDVHYRPVWLGVRGISDRAAATAEAQRALPSPNDAERVLWRAYAAAAAARLTRLIARRLLAADRPASAGDPGAPAWTVQDAS
jgi:nucleoside phosphorylase